MAPPYFPMIVVNEHTYWPEPYSLVELTPTLHHGLIPVGLFGILSVGTTVALISFILYRLVTWRLHYNTFLDYNQYVLLVLNLLIADLQQSAAFLLSFHWLRQGSILAPTVPCFVQAWLLHSGDLSSGFFVLAIAVHTFLTAVRGRRIGHRTFAGSVIFIWLLTYFLTGIGVGLYGDRYFVRAGAWCWIAEAFEVERLALHYVWVFLVQFGTVLIYIAIFILLRAKTRHGFPILEEDQDPNRPTVLAVNRITKLMMLYPCVYVLLTLPLCAGRMWSYAHHGRAYSDGFACVAGGMITSCGWVDGLLYTLTRRRLLKETMDEDSPRRPRDRSSMTITYTQTVTVEGSHALSSLDRKGTFGDGIGGGHARVRQESRTASTDPMLEEIPMTLRRARGFRSMIEDDRMQVS